MPDLLPMQGRSPGVHVSNVISDLCVRLGFFSGDTILTSVWAQLGCALEWAVIQRYARHYPNRYAILGELEEDGLFGTPDLYDMDKNAVVEIKLSWMSTKQPVDGPKYWRYWTQVKAYCKMVDSELGYLNVAHVMGAYDGKGPAWREWEARFTRKEINDNWQMLLNNAEQIRKRQQR